MMRLRAVVTLARCSSAPLHHRRCHRRRHHRHLAPPCTLRHHGHQLTRRRQCCLRQLQVVAMPWRSVAQLSYWANSVPSATLRSPRFCLMSSRAPSAWT